MSQQSSARLAPLRPNIGHRAHAQREAGRREARRQCGAGGRWLALGADQHGRRYDREGPRSRSSSRFEVGLAGGANPFHGRLKGDPNGRPCFSPGRFDQKRGVTEVIHLPVGADPPETDTWVRIERGDGGKFVVETFEFRHRPVVRFEPPAETFEAAVARAKEHAQRLGVATIYAFGCDEA